MSSAELLARYRDAGSDEAFTELVRRYADLVFSVAKRRLGSSALAEEAAQVVFMRLATNKPRLSSDHAVLGWLHRTTLHVSIDLVRAESRRRLREEKSMQTAQTDDEPLWHEIVPFLDEALDKLKEEERAILLLRFFDRKAFAQVGAAFKISEDAAKMRTTRALDKLRDLLVAQRIYCTAAVLGGLLLNRAVEAAPVSLSGKVLSNGLLNSGLPAKRSAWPSAAPGVRPLVRNMVIGTALLLLVGVLLKWAYRTEKNPGTATEVNSIAPAATSASASAVPFDHGVTVARRKFDPITTRFVLNLRDSKSGAPISGGGYTWRTFMPEALVKGIKADPMQMARCPSLSPRKKATLGRTSLSPRTGMCPRS